MRHIYAKNVFFRLTGWHYLVVEIQGINPLLMTFIVCVLRQEKHNMSTTSEVDNEQMINLGWSAESDLLTGLRRLRITTP